MAALDVMHDLTAIYQPLVLAFMALIGGLLTWGLRALLDVRDRVTRLESKIDSLCDDDAVSGPRPRRHAL